MLGTHNRQKLHLKKSANVTSLNIDLSQISWQSWPSTECVVLKIEYATT